MGLCVMWCVHRLLAQAQRLMLSGGLPIPNFMRRLVAEGAFSQAFVPILSSVMLSEDRLIVSRFIAQMAWLLGGCTALLTGLLMGAEWIVLMFSPGYHSDPQQLALAAHLLCYTAPYLFFIALAALAGAVLNCKDQFAWPAFAPVCLNLALMLAVGMRTHWQEPIRGLAVAVSVGGGVQCVLLWVLMRRAIGPVQWSWGAGYSKACAGAHARISLRRFRRTGGCDD